MINYSRLHLESILDTQFGLEGFILRSTKGGL
uniref:Uncharacterized protein n=1 Tax=Lepeophtheirus salmonis TaxID=72036 RepID=A0A0K2V9P3_LEPSM